MKYINPYKQFTGAFIPNWLLERIDISSGEKILYAKLAQYAGHKGYCWPSQVKLCNDIGITLNTLKKYLSGLKEKQLIISKQRGLNKTNVYFFLYHEWMKMPEMNGIDVQFTLQELNWSKSI